MKKLMFAVGAAALCGAVFATDVASQIVGFTSKTSGADNNFIAVPFNALGFNTCDIQQIKISDGGAGTIGWGTENFSLWEGVPTVAEGSEFSYLDPSMDPTFEATDYYWGDASSAKAEFSFVAGQGVVVNCGVDLEFITSGDVPVAPVTFTSIADNNFTGNPFPETIDIQAFQISDGGAGTIGWGTENFSVWEGVPTVVEGSEFSYLDPSMDPTFEATDYYWGDATSAKATYPLVPGQGVVINCGEGLEITINPPYTLK